MSLPNGYTELKWIKSSGTQYIDTGYKATSENYRIRCKFYFDTLVNNTVPFGGGASTDIISVLLRNNTQFHFYVGSGSVSATDFNVAQGVEYDMECHANNGIFAVTVNGASYSGNYSGTINKNHSLAIFGNNASGTVGQLTSIRISTFQIYDNDKPVRDFVPCMSPDGIIGLYDLVGGIFYGNSGTGVFTAGDAVLRKPDSPSGLDAVSENGSVTLTWEESENAAGYRVYENGALIADTQQTMLTVTSEPYSANIYAVTAYNEDGESDPAVIRVYTSGSSDVLDDLITDRTLLDVTLRTKKGVYNAFDINRVSTAAHRVRTVLAPLGYSTPEVSDYRWAVNEIPKSEEMAAHHASVIGQDVINYSKTKIDLPVSLSRLTHEGANNIEKFLRLCGEAAERIPEAYIYSGEIFGGDG